MYNNLSFQIKEIRKELGLSMEEFGKKFIPPASKGVVSNWENGYNMPNNARMAKIAELGSISVPYLLALSRLDNSEKEVIKCTQSYEELKREYERKEFDHLDESYLFSFLDVSELKNSNFEALEDLYEQVLEELLKKMMIAITERDLIRQEVNELKALDLKIQRNEVYSVKDRFNPEFEKNNISQKKIADFLHGIPYHLNFESTMKVAEYAKALLNEEENKFIPKNK